MSKGIQGHVPASPSARSVDWITPAPILKALSPFDLDPAASSSQPWPTARRMWKTGGLLDPWKGRVWLNPPYGPDVDLWLRRMADHGNGTALVFARTETRWFFDHVWNRASALLFVAGRITFYRPDGTIPSYTSGGPSVLVAYDRENAFAFNSAKLKHAALSSIPGKYVRLRT